MLRITSLRGITCLIMICLLGVAIFSAPIQAKVDSYGMDYREMSKLLRKAENENATKVQELYNEAEIIFLKITKSDYVDENLKKQALHYFETKNAQEINIQMLRIAFDALKNALNAKDIAAAKEWYEIRETKVKFDRDAPGLKAMVSLQKYPENINALAPVIVDDLQHTYLLKLKESLIHNDSREKAFGYFLIISDSLKESLANEDYVLINTILESKETISEVEAKKIEEILNNLLASKLSDEEVKSQTEKILRLLDYIERNWTVAIKDDKVFNAVEYSELKAFLIEINQRFLQIKPYFTDEDKKMIDQKLQLVQTSFDHKEDHQQINATLLQISDIFSKSTGVKISSIQSKNSNDPETIQKNVFSVLDQASEELSKGNQQKASDLIFEAYFTFEPLETKIAVKDNQLVPTIEKTFAQIRTMIKSNQPIDDINKQLKKQISDGVQLLISESSKWSLFFQSLLIILREGFEAILIIGALVAYMLKTGQKKQARYIYYGAIAAIVASVASAYLIRNVLKLSGANQEALEGITMLIAVFVLFYVSYWLINKIQGQKWQQFIKNKLQESASKGSLYSMGLVAFLAVYREGFETILFYQALLALGDDNSMILYGLIVGGLLLTILYVIISKFSIKIPIKPFFLFTSILLYLMAFSFAGHGIFELQEARMVPSHYLEGWPSLSIIGIYPTVETLLAQSVLLVALLFAVVVIMRNHTKVEANEGALSK